jgi:hypothetical protein
MITNAIKESGNEDAFIGHTDAGDFIILSSASENKQIAERCLVRLQPAIQYFYPALERPHLHTLPESDQLAVRVSHLSSAEHKFTDLESLFAALQD